MPLRRLGLALVLAVGLGIALTWMRPAPAPTAPASVPPAASAGESGVVTDPAAWQAVFPLEAPEVEPYVGPRADPVAEAMSEAMVPFRAGDYASAAPRFEEIWIDHPDAHHAALYLGITRLLTDEVPNGIEVLRQAEASPDEDIAAYARWYALVGIARLREPASGIDEVRAACERSGPFQDRACAALGRLTTP